jgi:hypothetical protein
MTGVAFRRLASDEVGHRPVVYGRYTDLSELGKAAFSGLSKGPCDDPRLRNREARLKRAEGNRSKSAAYRP